MNCSKAVHRDQRCLETTQPSGAFAALATSDWHPHAVPRHQFLEEEECRPSSDVDWQLVVSLRRQAAEQIGQASERWLTEHGTVMPEDDRRVQGRAIIRTVVHAHAERLSSEGAALWRRPSSATGD